MRIDYNEIRVENIRKYGEETDHLALFGDLYKDRTHFLFELLQNAEDARATRIRFNLFDDRLEVVHDGRVFDEQDVRGVCRIGKGTKGGDLTQIGKFGIGFKSVYAYTATPEIHSGENGFKITNYVRPFEVSFKPPCDSWTTLFVLPFDTEEKAPEIACGEISDRLRKLSARKTLLFLRNLNEIEYRLPDSTYGVCIRQERTRGTARQVSLIGQSNGKDEEENWLIFKRPVPIPGKSESVYVEVGFRLEGEDKAGKNSERIVKVKDSPLVVYFPTEKDTKFGFLIQGPYRTTPSRDNIRDGDEWNMMLVKETAKLVKDVLPEIKELGLLSVSFLETLPIKTDDFPDDSEFYPIVESVRNTLMKEELLPTDDGSFVSAKHAKLARVAKLRDLLNQAQLGQLFESKATIKWLTGEITSDLTRDLHSYLMHKLDIEEVTPESFARKIDHSFLSTQSDEWFINFYGSLLNRESLWEEPSWKSNSGGILRSKPILRLTNGSQEFPFKSDNRTPNVFLPPPERTDFPVVSRLIIADKQALTFLKRLGLSEPDIFDDIVEKIFPKYVKYTESMISDTEHQSDMRKIARALGSDSVAGKKKVLEEAKKIPFLKAILPTGKTLFKKPTEIYFNTDELRLYFSEAEDVYFLHNEYTSFNIDTDILQELGVSKLPRKLEISDLPAEEEREYMVEENRWMEITKNYDLHGLKNFIDIIQRSTDFKEQKNLASVLWGFLKDYIKSDKHFFQARYEWFYRKDRKKYVSSKILIQLKSSKWIPTKDGVLETPNAITSAQLLDGFRDAIELIENLGIVEAVDPNENDWAGVKEKYYAAKLGVSLDNIEFVKNNPKEFQQWKAAMISLKERPAFPARPVANSERRQEHLLDNFSVAPYKEYKKRERSVRTTRNTIDPATWLREQYTNETGQMVCQICKNEMPFKKRNGEYYFEEKEILSKKYLPKEYEAQHLALCPLCAAKYEEFVKNDDDAMSALKKNIIMAENDEIPLSLGDGDEEVSIRFVESHLHDLKVILDEMK